MNQIERSIQVEIAEGIIGNANRELASLRKVQTAGEQVLRNKTTDEVTRAGAAYEMDVLVKRIAAVEDRRHQAHRRIEELDQEAARQGEVKLISLLGDRAQIVIHYFRDDGKKVSYTRHIRRDGGHWIGFSTITANRVEYRLPGAALAEAA